MAIYSYMCNSCGYEFDEITQYDPQNKPIECPHDCGHTATRIPSLPSQAIGGFGTPRKKYTSNIATLKFKGAKNDSS